MVSSLYSSIAFGFYSKKMQKRIIRQEKEYAARMLRQSGLTDWDKVTRWQRWLYLQPHTFFAPEDHLAHLRESPGGPGKTIVLRKDNLKLHWMRLPARQVLNFVVGRREGKVGFSQACYIPVLAHRQWGTWESRMSITPMEVMSQKRGISYAKGHVVVGGLGLGWSVNKIARRPQVEKITIIEKDAVVLRKIKPKLKLPTRCEYEWIHGDMNEVAPTLEADLLFADIWDSYGNVGWERRRLIDRCKNIRRVWCWGNSGGG